MRSSFVKSHPVGQTFPTDIVLDRSVLLQSRQCETSQGRKSCLTRYRIDSD